MAWDGKIKSLKPIRSLEAAREFVAEMPIEKLDMDTYGGGTRCGTPCCLAGWVAISNGVKGAAGERYVAAIAALGLSSAERSSAERSSGLFCGTDKSGEEERKEVLSRLDRLIEGRKAAQREAS